VPAAARRTSRFLSRKTRLSPQEPAVGAFRWLPGGGSASGSGGGSARADVVARRDDTDLVILASADSDLEPALDEALELKSAKIETVSWYDAARSHRGHQLRPGGGRRLWNTRLAEPQFRASWDPTDYS
jgi:hypothetical protein